MASKGFVSLWMLGRKYQGALSRGSRCYSAFCLGKGEGKRKGKGKVFILAYILENHSHMDCEYGGVQGGRQQLDPHGMQMKTSKRVLSQTELRPTGKIHYSSL